MDVTYPVFFPFSDGDTLDGDDVLSLFYDPAAPSASLFVLSGNLDVTNFDSSFRLEHSQIQRGASVDAWAVAGTANLDYRRAMFGGRNVQVGEENLFDLAEGEKSYSIPGGSKTFYLPVQSAILLAWTIYWNHQAPDSVANPLTQIFLSIDGEPVMDCVRQAGESFSSGVEQIFNYSTNYGFQKARVYHGHYVTPFTAYMDPGFHTASLRITTDSNVIFSRVHARNMCVWRMNVP